MAQREKQTLPRLQLIPASPVRSHSEFVVLTGVGGHLDLCALGTLLALDPARLSLAPLALARRSGRLRLVRLLGLFGRRLLRLALRDGLLPRRLASLHRHRPPLLDHIERGTDDGPLRLDGTASALLGDFLFPSVSPSAPP